MTVTALEVQLRQERRRSIDLSRFTDTLDELARALREIDRLAIADAKRPSWTVEHIDHDGVVFFVRLTARDQPGKRDESMLLFSVEALVNGVKHLAEGPHLPQYYSVETVKRLLKIGQPNKGLSEVSLATVNGQAGPSVEISDLVLDNARRAVRPHDVGLSSISGRLDILNARPKTGNVRVSILEQATNRAVTGTAPARLVDELRARWGHRVLLGGQVTRNYSGQAVKIGVHSIEPMPEDDTGRPSTEQLLGIVPEWTGQATVDEYVREARRA